MLNEMQTAGDKGQFLLDSLQQGDLGALARAISLVENDRQGQLQWLSRLKGGGQADVIGITGPPGAGKSTLVDLLIGRWVEAGKRIAVLCVDPSSPFHSGALLGDRIRMRQWYNHPQVYIRSLASRGALGGLNAKIIEITALVSAAPFDVLLIETVGVGQNEVEIALLSETTVVVLVPETGDDIQAMKSGLLEIADILVVNKSDRPDAGRFLNQLRTAFGQADAAQPRPLAILQTVATENQGIDDLWAKIQLHQQNKNDPERKSRLLAEKAYQLLIRKRTADIDKTQLLDAIRGQLNKSGFNFYAWLDQY